MAAMGAGLQVIDSPLLTQQIDAQRLSIKHLKNENNKLKVRHIHLNRYRGRWILNRNGCSTESKRPRKVKNVSRQMKRFEAFCQICSPREE